MIINYNIDARAKKDVSNEDDDAPIDARKEALNGVMSNIIKCYGRGRYKSVLRIF